MIVLDLEQGTPEWVKARLGIPTSSRFKDIVTPAKLQRAKSAYIYELLFERMTGSAAVAPDSGWMERGRDLEADARAWYATTTSDPVRPVGFCLTDDRRAGASPDALVGDDGMLEIKCPAGKKHVAHLVAAGRMPDMEALPKLTRLEDEHRCQLQGQIWVAKRKWVDILSWCPGLPALVVRVGIDAYWRERFEPALDGFLADLDVLTETVREEAA